MARAPERQGARALSRWPEVLHVTLGEGDRAIADRTGESGLYRNSGVAAHWAVLTPASGSGAELALQLSTTPVQEHLRVHLDLATDVAGAQAVEVQRLVSLVPEVVYMPACLLRESLTTAPSCSRATAPYSGLPDGW